MFVIAWIDPVAVRLGPIAVHWYGIMYAIAFISAYGYFTYLSKKKILKLSAEQIDSFLFYSFIGMILGGRLGYVLFYNLSFYINNPAKIIAIWDGGLSFHGGLVGVILGGIIFCKKNKVNPWLIADYAVVIATLGMFLGRIGNFINGELYGIPTDLPVGIVFPGTDEPRHPSQLYEAGKNLLFFAVTLPFVIKGRLSKKSYKPGFLLWSFLMYYGIVRFLIEFVRMPDPQLGYIVFGVLTMGQLLSLSMIIISAIGFANYFFGSKK